ncbi:MAG TPA: pilus assembly protein TadG-related protein [Polyangia bacterium]|nr:pilus assembly protein TadG-related protein [Polyangia bacterium]
MRSDSGQAMVFIVFALMGLVLMAGLVIDGGSWRRTQRQVQTAADAAALAGAQDLPIDATASTTAVNYAQQNMSGIAAPTVTFPTDAPCVAHACIDVRAAKPVSGIFLAAINATARAHARAMVSVPSMMKNVAPVAVKNTVACAVTNPACYGQTVTLTFDESNVSSSNIGLIDLSCHSTSSTACPSNAGIGGSQLKDWIETGYADALPANQWYNVKTGETIGPVKQGFNDRVGVALFFPVFDTVATSGGSAYYFHIIGWAAFVIDPTGVTWTSQKRQLTGHFVTYTATDLAAGDPIGGATDFGVHVITLTQ